MFEGYFGTIEVTEHRIEITKDAKPSLQQHCTLELHKYSQKIKKLRRCIIAAYGTRDIRMGRPDGFSPTKFGALRFCVYYHSLNATIIFNSYQIPRMDKCTNSIATYNFFSALDCNQRQWQMLSKNQIDIRPSSRSTMYYTSSCECHSDYARFPLRSKSQLILSCRQFDSNPSWCTQMTSSFLRGMPRNIYSM